MVTKFTLFEKKINLGKMDLPKDILDIYKIFNQNKKELYICGGAVRDFVNNQEPHDIDLVTNAKPDEIINILKDKYRIDLQGKQFGVIRVFTKNFPIGIEVASYRTDLVKGRDNKGIHKKVDTENTTIHSDSKRRDLTINALYYDIGTGDIIDLVGGLKDINKNKIKAVGKASKRFEEDRLRILRVCRFASRNLSKIGKKTREAIQNDHRLRNISPEDDVSQERIVEEFVKAVEWAQEHNKPESLKYYLELLEQYGMFEEMFPGLGININNINSYNLSIIFALLFRDNEIDKLRSKLRKYKFPNDIADTACFLLRLKDYLHTLDKVPILYKEKVRYHVDNQTIEEFADLYNFNDKYLQAFLKYEPKINATEFMSGLKDAEIGIEKKRREIEEFKKLVNEHLNENINEIAMKIITKFYGKILPKIKFEKNNDDRMKIIFRNCWLVKTFPPSETRNYLQYCNLIHFYGDTVGIRKNYPEFSNLQMCLKMFFDFLLKDKLEESDMIIDNDKTSHTFLSAFNLDKAAKVIIDNQNELTVKNFEFFSNVNKYNL